MNNNSIARMAKYLKIFVDGGCKAGDILTVSGSHDRYTSFSVVEPGVTFMDEEYCGIAVRDIGQETDFMAMFSINNIAGDIIQVAKEKH